MWKDGIKILSIIFAKSAKIILKKKSDIYISDAVNEGLSLGTW